VIYAGLVRIAAHGVRRGPGPELARNDHRLDESAFKESTTGPNR